MKGWKPNGCSNVNTNVYTNLKFLNYLLYNFETFGKKLIFILRPDFLTPSKLVVENQLGSKLRVQAPVVMMEVLVVAEEFQELGDLG